MYFFHFSDIAKMLMHKTKIFLMKQSRYFYRYCVIYLRAAYEVP